MHQDEMHDLTPPDPLWEQFDHPAPRPDAVDIVGHIIDSECLAHTYRLLAVLKLIKVDMVTIEQAITLGEAHVSELKAQGELGEA